MKRMLSGIWIKKTLAVVFLLTLAGMTRLFAFPIAFTAPQLGPSGNPVAGVVQGEFNAIFNDVTGDIQNLVNGISSDPQKLIGAFADSSVFASTGASLRTFQGYDAFALTVGVMTGIQVPRNIFSMFEYFEEIAAAESPMLKLLDEINNEHDLQVGVNPQILNAQLGINSRFLLKGLYLGLKGGYMNLPASFFDNFFDAFQMSFQTWSAGGLINYQLIPQFRLLGGLIVWRGLNLGAGFIYQNTGLNLNIPLMPLLEDHLSGDLDNLGGTGAKLDLGDPRISFIFNIDTYTVPLEAVTSFRFLGFANASIGAGVDFGFGNANMKGKIDSKIEVKNLPDPLVQNSPGRMYASIGGSRQSTLVNPKAMASFGFSAGPAIILDIPVTYYFLNNGFSVGITLGIAL